MSCKKRPCVTFDTVVSVDTFRMQKYSLRRYRQMPAVMEDIELVHETVKLIKTFAPVVTSLLDSETVKTQAHTSNLEQETIPYPP